MPKTCLTCLTHDNLLDLCEREWKVLEYLIYPHQKQLTGILKANEESGICDKCQSSVTCIDDFRTSAMGNFGKLMERWIKGIETDQIEIKIEPSTSIPVKTEQPSTNDDSDPEQVFIKEEPIPDGVDTVNDDDVKDDEDDNSSSLVTEDSSTKIMLASVLQNMYVVQPSPPQTIQVVDIGTLQHPRADEALESETSAAEAEGCKSRGKTKRERKHTKKANMSTKEPVDGGPPNKKPKEPQCSTNTNTQNKQLKCEYCPKRFDSQEEKQTHVDTAHDSAPAKICDICSIPFHSVYKYNTHMKTHGSTIHCDVCDRWYRPHTYRIHMRTSRKHNKVEDFKYGCEQCDARFPLKLYLERHVISVHDKLKPFKCPQCPAAYARPDRLKDHVSISHEKQPPAKNHECKECGVKMRSKKQLQAHMVRHTGERPYKCKICLSTFGYNAALYTHNKLMHENVRRPKKSDTDSNQEGSFEKQGTGANVGDSEKSKDGSDARKDDYGTNKEKTEEKTGDSDAIQKKSDGNTVPK